jgi:PAS domain S-box-containing protein
MAMISPFTLVLFGTSLTVLFAATFAWRRRDAPGGLTLTLIFAALTIWCFFSAMETTAADAYHRYLWDSICFIGLCNVPPLFLVFAVQYSDSGWALSPWMLALFWSVPVATIVLAFTNSLHHLIWTGFTTGPVSGTNTVIYHHGPWYFLAVAWLLGLTLLGAFHILRVAIRAARLYVLQAVVLVTGIILPGIGLLLYALPKGPAPGLDTMSIGFAASAILMVAASSRTRFMDIVPRARATLVERMSLGFIVVDALDRVIDINHAARFFSGTDSSVIGKKLADALPSLGDISDRTAEARTLTMSSPRDRTLTFEVSISPLAGRGGARQTGRMLLLRDVTERKRAEEERERLVAELREALAKIKKLSGLLPICSSCKRIRDDHGYWHQVEHYMKDHAEVEFSHGLCPECMAKLYPEPGAR